MAEVVMHLMLPYQETRYCQEKDIRPFNRLPDSSNTLNCPALSGPGTDDTADTPSILLKRSTTSCAIRASSRRELNSLLVVFGGGVTVIDIFVLAASVPCASGTANGWPEKGCLGSVSSPVPVQAACAASSCGVEASGGCKDPADDGFRGITSCNVDSEPENGATFSVLLPCMPGEPLPPFELPPANGEASLLSPAASPDAIR
mmetsp:Transcript_51417/g.99376  ORF Transcript_51417/g.99376 Transcript_51417/m.99376 type:complete len:203 (+) Transcript_51417:87-695(+)